MTETRLDRLRRTPAYSFVEAAHYLRLPVSTLRSWILGQAYMTRHGDQKQFRPLIHLDGHRNQGLSFLNLVEAHVLAAITRLHGVRLQKVRTSLQYVRRKLRVDRPLISTEFQTDGADLFVEQLGALLNVVQDGQIEIREVIQAHLRRVERDPAGIPIKLYPFTRRPEMGTNEEIRAIVIDPTVAFGRPVLAGRAVPTSVLADRFKAGDSLADMAGDYDTSTEPIEEAIRCEFDRRKVA